MPGRGLAFWVRVFVVVRRRNVRKRDYVKVKKIAKEIMK